MFIKFSSNYGTHSKILLNISRGAFKLIRFTQDLFCSIRTTMTLRHNHVIFKTKYCYAFDIKTVLQGVKTFSVSVDLAPPGKN